MGPGNEMTRSAIKAILQTDLWYRLLSPVDAEPAGADKKGLKT
jgi:hypothetical protein